MRFLVVCLLMFCSTSVFASITDYVVKQWNIQNGLPSQSLKSIAQDEQGYMWLGTQFGLSRFDGNTFTNFNTQNSDFLPSNGINKLLVDSDWLTVGWHQKWVSHTRPRNHDVANFNVKGPVRDILEDSKGSIWIAANGLYYVARNQVALQQNSALIVPVSNATAITQIVGSVSQMALSPEGIWLVNERHLLRLTNTSSDFAKLRLELTAKVSFLSV